MFVKSRPHVRQIWCSFSSNLVPVCVKSGAHWNERFVSGAHFRERFVLPGCGLWWLGWGITMTGRPILYLVEIWLMVVFDMLCYKG